MPKQLGTTMRRLLSPLLFLTAAGKTNSRHTHSKVPLFFLSPKLYLMVQLFPTKLRNTSVNVYQREYLQKQIRTCHLKLADAQNIEKVVEIRNEAARCMRHELVTLNLARRQDKSEKKLKGLQDVHLLTNLNRTSGCSVPGCGQGLTQTLHNRNVSRSVAPGFVHFF